MHPIYWILGGLFLITQKKPAAAAAAAQQPKASGGGSPGGGSGAGPGAGAGGASQNPLAKGFASLLAGLTGSGNPGNYVAPIDLSGTLTSTVGGFQEGGSSAGFVAAGGNSDFTINSDPFSGGSIASLGDSNAYGGGYSDGSSVSVGSGDDSIYYGSWGA